MKYLILAAVAFSIPVVLGLPVAGLHNDGALTPRFVVRHDDILSARGLSLSNLKCVAHQESARFTYMLLLIITKPF